MAAEHWFRWHHGCVTDPKWRVIASRCVTSVTVGHVVAVWAAMMENASQAAPRGTLSNWDDEDVAALLGFSVEQVADIRSSMQGKVLGGDELKSWEKRQPKREDDARSRTREWRERNRSRDDNSQPVTQCDAHAEAVTLETETETETEVKAKATVQQAAPASFDRFWQSYPNRKGKGPALKAWQKQRLEAMADQIIGHVAQMQAQDDSWKRGYVPMASTYLNQQRWHDVPQGQAAGGYSGSRSSSGYVPMPGEI